MTTFISPKTTTSLPYSTNTNRWYLICKSKKSGTIDGFFPEYLICKSEKSILLRALIKVSCRNQVICSSFAFPGFVGTEQHSYDFQIQVVLAQRFSFHYSRNQVICLSFAFSGFVRASQHPYDFEIQVVLAQRFVFHYCPGSRSGLFCPLLAAPRCCLLRTIVQMLHPCISFLHKHTDFAVLLWFHVFDAVF